LVKKKLPARHHQAFVERNQKGTKQTKIEFLDVTFAITTGQYTANYLQVALLPGADLPHADDQRLVKKGCGHTT
jgi:hypothetical protein